MNDINIWPCLFTCNDKVEAPAVLGSLQSSFLQKQYFPFAVEVPRSLHSKVSLTSAILKLSAVSAASSWQELVGVSLALSKVI